MRYCFERRERARAESGEVVAERRESAVKIVENYGITKDASRDFGGVRSNIYLTKKTKALLAPIAVVRGHPSL